MIRCSNAASAAQEKIVPSTKSFPFELHVHTVRRLRAFWGRNSVVIWDAITPFAIVLSLVVGIVVVYFRTQQVNDAKHWNQTSRVWNWEELPESVLTISTQVGPDKLLLVDGTGDRFFLVRKPADLDVTGRDVCHIAEKRCF